MAKEISSFKDFLNELLLVTKSFENLGQSDKEDILDYILKKSPFLSYLDETQSDFLSIYVMAFLHNYDCLIKYNLEQKEYYKDKDYKVPFLFPYEELREEARDNLNKILLDFMRVMNAKNIYKSYIKSFRYSLEQRLITNADEYLKAIYSELFIEIEKCTGSIYSVLGEAVAKGENVESLKASIIMETFIYKLANLGDNKEDRAFFANILAHYSNE